MPGWFLYEDDKYAAFLDKFPAVQGQAVVIIKKEIPYLFSLTDDEYSGLLKVAKKVALAIDRTLTTERTCMVVEGFEVPHVHIKLYPMTKENNLVEVMANQSEASAEDLTNIADKIKRQLTWANQVLEWCRLLNTSTWHRRQ